jgi:RecB family endonuclease NucS
VCYYSADNKLAEGTVPNVIIELKLRQADAKAVAQVERYLDWLYRIDDRKEFASAVKAFVLAPSYSAGALKARKESRRQAQIELVEV